MNGSCDFNASVLDSLGEMVFQVDRELRVKWSSEPAGKFVGSSGADLVDRFCYEQWCRRNRPCTDCPTVKAIETGQIQQCEVTNPDGKIWEVHSYPVCDNAGAVIGATEFRREITGRKNSEKARRKQEKRYRIIWENVDDLIYFISMDRKIVSVNPACEKITGWPVEYWIGKDIRAYIRAAQLSKADDFFARFMQGGNAGSAELDILTKSGEYRTIEFRPAAVLNEGDTVQIVGVGSDVTHHRQARDKLRKAQRQLAEHLTQTQRINEELAQFAYAVSHDLKAPLRAIANYAGFLSEDLAGSLSGDQDKYLQGLMQAARHGEALINDLLSFSRLGKVLPVVEPVSVPGVVNEIRCLLYRSPAVVIDVQPQWPDIRLDRTLLKQVLQNLIANGLKFNTSPRKHIEIGWQPAPDDGIEIFVRDNGIGIEPKHQDQIFRIFRRLHTQSEYEGTGIGLAIVKKAAQSLGGSIRLVSTAGEGSTFYVSLPGCCLTGKVQDN